MDKRLRDRKIEFMREPEPKVRSGGSVILFMPVGSSASDPVSFRGRRGKDGLQSQMLE